MHYGCRTWIDEKFDGKGHHRQVNKVLGNICRLKWPGVVLENGREVVVTKWKQYKLAFHAQHRDAQGVVWHEFMVQILLSSTTLIDI